MNQKPDHLTTLPRQELYDRIWTTPASKLAKEFGVSDVGLAKICKRHKIPRPPRGYRARLAHGKRVRRQSLPPLDDEALDEVRIFRQQFFGHDDQTQGAEGKRTEIVVPDVLENPHPLVSATQRHLQTAQPGVDGLLTGDRSKCLPIRVAKPSLERALRIFDALIKNWESLGGSVRLGHYNVDTKPAVAFQLRGDYVAVAMAERVERIVTMTQENRRFGFRAYEYKTTGQLFIQTNAYCGTQRRRWSDGKRQRLESMLGPLVASLLRGIEGNRARRLDQECEERQRQAVKALREAAKRRQELEEQRRKQLLEKIAAWKQAAEIREYLKAGKEALADGRLRMKDENAYSEWSEWAGWFADVVDPWTNARERPESVPTPTNTPVADLDLTRKARAIVSQLGVQDTDQLFAIKQSAVEAICGRHGYCCEWNEICRVLAVMNCLRASECRTPEQLENSRLSAQDLHP